MRACDGCVCVAVACVPSLPFRMGRVAVACALVCTPRCTVRGLTVGCPAPLLPSPVSRLVAASLLPRLRMVDVVRLVDSTFGLVRSRFVSPSPSVVRRPSRLTAASPPCRRRECVPLRDGGAGIAFSRLCVCHACAHSDECLFAFVARGVRVRLRVVCVYGVCCARGVCVRTRCVGVVHAACGVRL